MLSRAVLFLALVSSPGIADDMMCTVGSHKPDCTSALPASPSSRTQLDLIAQKAAQHGAKSKVREYPAHALDEAVKAASKSLRERLPNRGGCRYATTATLQANFAELLKRETDPAATEALKALERQPSIRKLLRRASRASERCGHQAFELFTSDGYALSLDY